MITIDKALKTKVSGKIQHITHADMDELVLLHSIYLNYGEGIRPHFESILNNPKTVALKYVYQNEIVGVLIYTEGIALSGEHHDLEKDIRKKAGDQIVYTGDAVLVKKDYRSMNIAAALYEEAVTELRGQGASLVLHELWVYPDGKIPAQKVLNHYSAHQFLGQFEGFYKDFYHYGYVCPICGEHCICAATLYLSEV
jgi:GNAT superfamily N-acetyltransferase